MFCKLVKKGSQSFERRPTAYLWCDNDFHRRPPEADTDDNLPRFPCTTNDEHHQEEDRVDADYNQNEDLSRFPQTPANVDHHVVAPRPYEAYHHLRDRRSSNQQDDNLDCEEWTCAPYSRVRENEKEVYDKWVVLETVRGARRHGTEHEQDDIAQPSIYAENQMALPVDVVCSKLPTEPLFSEQLLSPRRYEAFEFLEDLDAQWHDRVVRTPHDLEAQWHIKDCHRRGPTLHKKALWSITNGGI